MPRKSDAKYKPKKEITTADITAICKCIEETGMKYRRAARLNNINPNHLSKLLKDDEVVQHRIEQAIDKCVDRLHRRLQEPGIKKPEVDGIELILRTIDPLYRKQAEETDRINVIMTLPPAPERAIQIQEVEAVKPLELPSPD
jgi:hypothetical protein